MYIVYKENEIKQLQSNYLLLEMDTIKISDDETIVARCVIPTEAVEVNEMSNLEFIENLHKGMIEHYKAQEWDLCEDAIDHLKGHFKGEVDSFYDNLLTRVKKLKGDGKNTNWSHVIDKTIS